MSIRIFHAAVPIGVKHVWLGDPEALRQQVTLVLTTRPGTVPWRPEFGCELASLSGLPATEVNLAQARFHVQRAINRWIPGVEVLRCELQVIANEASMGWQSHEAVPIAERALVRLGTQASLEIHLDLATTEGRVRVATTLQP